MWTAAFAAEQTCVNEVENGSNTGKELQYMGGWHEMAEGELLVLPRVC